MRQTVIVLRKNTGPSSCDKLDQMTLSCVCEVIEQKADSSVLSGALKQNFVNYAKLRTVHRKLFISLYRAGSMLLFVM